MNIETLKWDPLLCRFFGIPADILPEIRSCSEVYGNVTYPEVLSGVPISGVSETMRNEIRSQNINDHIFSAVRRRSAGSLGRSDVPEARPSQSDLRDGLLPALQHRWHGTEAITEETMDLLTSFYDFRKSIRLKG